MMNNDQGFTLVELISTVAMSSLFVGLILYFGISYWRYSSLLENDSGILVSRLNAQDFIRESVGTTSGLINQNSIPDSHANNPDPIVGANYWVTMHAVPGNIALGSSGTTPLLYYRRLSVNSSGNVIMNGSQPYEDEYVLYLNSSTKELLVRNLANPSAANNRLKTSCPPALATSACPADRILLGNLSSVDVAYYSRSGNAINWQSIYDNNTGTYAGPDFAVVEALQYTFHVVKKTLFQKSNSTINDTVVRIALRNT